MIDFIRKYYHDNVRPKSVRDFPTQLAEQYAHMGALEGLLFNTLDKDADMLFSDYAVTCYNAAEYIAEESFAAGFRHGAHFAADVFNNGSDESFLRDAEIATDL